MATSATNLPKPKVVRYPESDGKPMAENTLQFRWIVTIEGGLDALFRDRLDVFVAGDLLWYPVEGDNTICVAPDAMVVFGRPKGDRRSYLQWLEDHMAPQVVFEVLSPGNRAGEMIRKFQFYERYGVDEYYLYDPDNNLLTGYLRSGSELREIEQMNGWLSPRLSVRFELGEQELRIIGPDGVPFASYLELVEQRERERLARETAEETSKLAHQQAEELRAQLRALGVEPKT
jgi:Uma2 family endonuclease